MKQKFRELLHEYKVQSFKISHNHNGGHKQIAEEILRFTSEALNNAYKFHFHQDPDPKRIETFNMIRNYTLEALLPPVLEKIMYRVTVLERQHQELFTLIDNLLEALSEDGDSQRDAV